MPHLKKTEIINYNITVIILIQLFPSNTSVSWRNKKVPVKNTSRNESYL